MLEFRYFDYDVALNTHWYFMYGVLRNNPCM